MRFQNLNFSKFRTSGIFPTLLLSLKLAHWQFSYFSSRLQLWRLLPYLLTSASFFLITADIFEQVSPAIEDQGLDCEVLGGGRILHESKNKKIEIFGYSQVRRVGVFVLLKDWEESTVLIGWLGWLVCQKNDNNNRNDNYNYNYDNNNNIFI